MKGGLIQQGLGRRTQTRVKHKQEGGGKRKTSIDAPTGLWKEVVGSIGTIFSLSLPPYRTPSFHYTWIKV